MNWFNRKHTKESVKNYEKNTIFPIGKKNS